MKHCQFCAEDIQDAAIVCKHCGRDLAAKTPRRRWPWIALAVLVSGYYLVQWSRADFLEFDARREDWHRRCDAYIAPAAAERAAQAAACKAELDELMAYASRKGWQR